MEIRFTVAVENNTTDILLNGIKMAAVKGVKFPVTANDNPTRLYKKDSPKPVNIITRDHLASRIKLNRWVMADA